MNRHFSKRIALALALPVSLTTLVGIPLAPASAAPRATAAPAAVTSVKGYTPLVPVRICDTRPVAGGTNPNQCNHNGASAGTLGPSSSLDLVVAGANGVPLTATAFVLNVTVTDTTGFSFLTVWPTGVTRPTAGNMVWQAGQAVTNLVQVASANGSVSVYNNAGVADVVVDLQGYVDSASANLYSPVSPVRICDSRAAGPGVGPNQCQGAGGSAGTMAPSTSRTIIVAGPAAGVTAAVMNITVTNPTSFGFFTVWPHGATRPLAGNLVWAPGQTVSNRVMVGITGGQFDIFIGGAGSADVIVDVNGFFSTGPGSGFAAVLPTRLCDTRPIQPGVAANICNNPATAPNNLIGNDEGILTFAASEKALVFNVTVTNTTATSYLTVFPEPNSGGALAPPLAADMAWLPGQTVANFVVVAPAGVDFAIGFYNFAGNADLIVDGNGFYTTVPTPGASVVKPSAATRPTVSFHRVHKAA